MVPGRRTHYSTESTLLICVTRTALHVRHTNTAVAIATATALAMHVAMPGIAWLSQLLTGCMQCECRGDDLDTRLLRAMVIKGILEQITNNTVNLVNADLLAKTRGLRIIESIVPAEGRSVTALCGTCFL